MIKGYTIAKSPEDVQNHFNIHFSEHKHAVQLPLYNAAPGMQLPVITNQNKQVIEFFSWGLVPEWSPDPSNGEQILYAGIENVNYKATLKKTLSHKRCLIPADGFYAWRNTETGRIPYRITLSDEGIFAFAGLWDKWEDEENNRQIYTFTIITRPSSNQLSAITDHMPLVINKADESKWLDNSISANEAISILNNTQEQEFKFYTVSRRINDANANHKDLIKQEKYEIPVQAKLF